MRIKLQKNEISKFIELLYLGNWMANGIRQENEILESYETLFLAIIKQVCPKNSKYDEEELHDKLAKIIDFYDSGIFYSEFAKQYADCKQPYNLSELLKSNHEAVIQYAGNCVLKDACHKELKQNGLKNVIVELPELSDETTKKLGLFKNS